uniref:Actin-related protein 2/3 complex subunit 5 n=1 Tax=Phaeomonas parva TaxID=124430 RepID=A0A7S1XSX2_9STRA|mmetsp:Transcript_3136/g.8942  ORF Transcript_3136/g.8942 Transcript_3136/m.8942 type:complete len:121 (+) Transcript_3136:233-595(+)|eukprot:CAMPEP_0118854570 /NCGR_PEP_ID=MMETSP1163-20130328/2732_1 /TAXON_ID=124430 /ORGANISM="Phaeomonas parva, Strain CCMP2877" /LENGTH=120 /DNA_ID=CAMNT_0006787317 /DNA_START=188 /DNA_END=550 /DNA_ORIENTATION=-
MADDALMQAVEARKAEVSRMTGASAVMRAIEDPPFATRNQAAKDANAAVVLGALATVSDTAIPGVVDGLSEAQVDILTKYVYKGLESGENAGSLFKWHAKLAAKGGLGTIVRAMTDRKTA